MSAHTALSSAVRKHFQRWTDDVSTALLLLRAIFSMLCRWILSPVHSRDLVYTQWPRFACGVRNVLVQMYDLPHCAQTHPFQLCHAGEACLGTEQFNSVSALLNNTPATFCVHSKTVWPKCKYLAANTAYSRRWEILLKKEGCKLISSSVFSFSIWVRKPKMFCL